MGRTPHRKHSIDMPRFLQLLIGPELIWLLFFGITSLLVKAYAPSKGFDNFLENFYVYVPLASLLAFALWYVPGIEKSGCCCGCGLLESWVGIMCWKKGWRHIVPKGLASAWVGSLV